MERTAARLAPLLLALATPALAIQETDITQTPNAANAGIKKSYPESVGYGRGDVLTPNSSAFVIARDPFRAVARGRQLFQRKFTLAQGLGPRTNDGIGNIETDASHGAGLADSCAACHGRPQGAAGFGGDVFTRTTSRDAPHLFGLGLQEMIADEMTGALRALRDEALTLAIDTGVPVKAVLFAKSVSFGSLLARPDGSIDTTGVVGVDADLRVRPFFAQGGTVSIREFLVGAFNAEMGLEAFDPDLLAAAAKAKVTTPAGMVLDGTRDTLEGPPATGVLDDPDGDGVLDEVPESIVDYMEFYLLNYFKPGVRFDRSPQNPTATQHARRGRRVFDEVGCAACHVAEFTIESDRRVADVETLYDPLQGNPFNSLFATAAGLFEEVDDGSGHPTLKLPKREPFLVRNFFADMKRHDLGPNFWEQNFDGTLQKEFMTEPLWGVGSTSPYGHDGRSPTLEDVILRHGGEAQVARDAFAALAPAEKDAVIEFLQTLVLFSPPGTASNLEGTNPLAPDYPVRGQGSINLSVLFNNPSDKE